MEVEFNKFPKILYLSSCAHVFDIVPKLSQRIHYSVLMDNPAIYLANYIKKENVKVIIISCYLKL